MNEPPRIRWGILGTGAIARTFARALASTQTGSLHAVASREQTRADRFGDELAASTRYGSYEAILSDGNVDAIYVATPHPFHATWAIRATEAKKHVLVEKPFAVNHAEAMAVIEAAAEHDVLVMEAFMYRCHPQTASLVELIRAREIGDVRVIHATFSFHASFNADSRLFANRYAGGGIMDVGCYPVSIARLIAGAALGRDFAEPIDVKGCAHLGATGVDEWAIASLRFQGDILAQLATGVSLNQENVVRIFGSEGQIVLPNPWVMNRSTAEQGRLFVQRSGQNQPREIRLEAAATSFALEVDVFGRAVQTGLRDAPAPAMSREDTVGNIRTLDRWRESVGLEFEFEKPAGFPHVTVAGRPVSVRPNHNMIYGRIAGLEKPVSRLVMGCDNQSTLPHAYVMFDHFFERGGNAFDTAYVYGGGLQERLLGQWIKNRGVRDRVVVIVKGAHTPFCDPANLTRQLEQSLERLGTDHADIYLMHRDNPDVPASEFVDVLNEHGRAGRIRAFGGSNWTLQRVDDANAYARQNSLTPFALVSNQFSLARMIEPVWAGCVSASDDESREWFTRTQTALLAWSSQARGFFAPGRAAPDKRDDAELVRCWYSQDNFQRLERAAKLAAEKNASPINIALAYVLNQPFPTFALIGPRTVSETRKSLPALSVKLSNAEMRWLNLED
jgi:predicted dehydrogenase/aryl-alcohol dehydrogenase-like predicted oxidoreductase